MLISARLYESLYFINLHVSGVQIVPGIVIAYPGQNVTLSCSIASVSTKDATIGWSIDDTGPYGLNALHNGRVPGYSTYLDKTDLIIENIMMNDNRNDTEYRCMILQNTTIRSNATTLYVTGKCILKITCTITCY